MNLVIYYLIQLWSLLVNHGLPLAALLIVAILIPRIGRLAVRVISQRFDSTEEATKGRLALLGALVYVLEAIAFFVVVMLALANLGVPATSAAIPATVVSAAIGFGAQNVIKDFVAGFFIISERQFGVGDYVSFDGPSSAVEGTVVALTLRATRIRTPAGETVMVPNGSAGVVTNYSQEWSRAVVDIEIPLQPGESMDHLTEKVRAAAHRAVQDPQVAGDITGDLDVLPAMKLVQPLAAGQPWAITFRTTVTVVPARQWAAERAIRSAIVNTFWDRFNVSDLSSAVSSVLDGSTPPSSIADKTSSLPQADPDTPTELYPAASPHTPGDLDTDPDTGAARVGDQSHSGNPTGGRPLPAQAQTAATEDTDGKDTNGKDTKGKGVWRNVEYDNKIQRWLSLNGRTRMIHTMNRRGSSGTQKNHRTL
ncbi:mechanosensitive ion channel family protein [Corynebacterium heidelbergense]|uniref:Mechanosensitive ion channel MscS domain-containing protein n=1 Tax=Corynebacterium heidelbergense TaxID=2055947 RepID=A0A364V558_9CORY|nr:mechanosensitive ion channel family protein [Corynebacterium heidelbergense]RAV31775.1 hypothetical protein DLJ54_06685 [Corynebacterium heidelbergense]